MHDEILNILTVVGARPQFIKAAMVSHAVIAHNEAGRLPRLAEAILHTGQHYDEDMSQAFFDELGIPEPEVNLQVGSGLHGETTGKMLAGIEKEILARRPDWVMVYGDTNSTLAGALAGVKLHVPVAHVEAGLRSFNRRMPEEINRLVTDHVAQLLFCPTETAVRNLTREGIAEGVCQVGDVMYDAAMECGDLALKHGRILEQLHLRPKSYYLATVHRAENTEDLSRLRHVLRAFADAATPDCPIVFPVHPRTRNVMESLLGGEVENLAHNEALKLIGPVSFLDMVLLEKCAALILTDSGGVQKEAYFHRVPCVTLRDETEWTELIELGWNRLCPPTSESSIAAAIQSAVGSHGREDWQPFGTGKAAGSVVEILAESEPRGVTRGPASPFGG